jgi:thiol-disulfide isomerase/thioredoxin
MPRLQTTTLPLVVKIVLTLTLMGGCAATPPDTPTPTAEPEVKPFELPGLRLPTPEEVGHRAYLGVDPGETFALADIRTRILIIEVFNFYCPHCQKEAPNVNRLYRQIENDARLRGQIKIIGIGIGNTAYEINQFRQKYAIPFPLFPDRSRSLSIQLEIRRTPTFIGWVYHPNGDIRPFLHAPGPMGGVAVFLDQVVRQSGVELAPGY